MALCPQCQRPLSPSAPAGLCPACLLQRGLESNTLPPDTLDPQSKIENKKSKIWHPPALADLAPFFPDLDLLEFLGRGGMGAVYKARQKSLDRIVALKILPPAISHDPAFAVRFTYEAQAMARLNHPHIVTVHEFGERTAPLQNHNAGAASLAGEEPPAPATKIFYFLMEFVDGMTLGQLLAAGTLTPKDALAIVPQICDALQYAHDRGIIHRDIKPENILLTRAGQIKIADFGLAKLIGKEIPTDDPLRFPEPLATTTAAGTPAYMAPEQSTAGPIDHRADIYALGVVFYQLLTGELPKGQFVPPSRRVQIDVRLDEVVLKALEREPEKRYQNATELRTQIETVMQTMPAQAPAPAPSLPAKPPAHSEAPTPHPIGRWRTTSLALTIIWLVVSVAAILTFSLIWTHQDHPTFANARYSHAAHFTPPADHAFLFTPTGFYLAADQRIDAPPPRFFVPYGAIIALAMVSLAASVWLLYRMLTTRREHATLNPPIPPNPDLLAKARRAILWPALGILLTSALLALIFAIHAILFLDGHRPADELAFLSVICGILPALFSFTSAINLLRLTQRRSILLACGLSTLMALPRFLLSPLVATLFNLACVGFSTWAVVILIKPDIIAAFESKSGKESGMLSWFPRAFLGTIRWSARTVSLLCVFALAFCLFFQPAQIAKWHAVSGNCYFSFGWTVDGLQIQDSWTRTPEDMQQLQANFESNDIRWSHNLRSDVFGFKELSEGSDGYHSSIVQVPRWIFVLSALLGIAITFPAWLRRRPAGQPQTSRTLEAALAIACLLVVVGAGALFAGSMLSSQPQPDATPQTDISVMPANIER